MKSKWKLVLFLGLMILLVSSVIGCSGGKSYTDKDVIAAYYRGYEDGQSEISKWKLFEAAFTSTIILPSDWTRESKASGDTFFDSPKDSAYVVITASFDKVGIDAYISNRISSLEKYGSTFVLLSNTPIKHHGFSGRVIEYTWQDVLTGLTQPTVRYAKQLIVIDGDTIYTAEFNVWQSHYSSYSSTIDRMLFSFHFR